MLTSCFVVLSHLLIQQLLRISTDARLEQTEVLVSFLGDLRRILNAIEKINSPRSPLSRESERCTVT